MTSHLRNVGIQPTLKTFLARAVYDNISENAAELNFSRGDLLTVLDRNPSGLKGWWVCSIRGQLGIAPGNRLELLGLINKNKERDTSDVYDDPTGWCISNNDSSNNNNNNPYSDKLTSSFKPTSIMKSSGLEQTRASSNQNSGPVYENLDHYTKHYSPVGLTDSGNFSNLSSDVSFSIQSMNDGAVGQRNNLDDSYEDYEDLPASIPDEFRDSDRTQTQIKQESVHFNHNHEKTQNEINHFEESSLQIKKDQLHPSVSVQKLNDIKIESNSSCLNEDRSLLNGMNTKASKISTSCSPLKTDFTIDIDRNKLKSSVELTPSTFNSVKDFTGYWLPIQARIQNKCLNLMNVLHQSKSLDSTGSIFSLFSQLDNEFIVISQLCTIMIGLSKQSSLDYGLTRKFITYRQNMENLGEIFINFSKRNLNTGYNNQKETYHCKDFDKQSILNMNRNDHVHTDENDKTITLFEHTIQQLLTEVNLFYTTILANSKILFNNSNNKSSELVPKICQSVQESNTSYQLNIPFSSFSPITDNLYQSFTDDRKFLSKSHESISTISNSMSKQQIEFSKLQKFQNSHFQKLSQLCLSVLKVIDEYFNYLLQFQNDTVKGYSFSHKNLTRNSLSIQSIIGQTKMVMQSCSEVIRCTSMICNDMKLSSSSHYDDNLHNSNSLSSIVQVDSLKKLEYIADQICEALKGLVTQTKEIAKFITNDFENLPYNKIIPIPGPLLQRLNGALKSVQYSIETLNKWVNKEYCQKSNTKYLSEIQMTKD
ncbi:unnamed protein product [Heterobilharzia americana]|nr:unnamed protein product [Heterobilharzia americana]